MPIDEDRLVATVDALRGELIAAIQELVRIPTENLPPGGNERAGQEHLARRLRDLGLDVELYALADVPGLTEQASYWPGRDLSRPAQPHGRLARPGRRTFSAADRAHGHGPAGQRRLERRSVRRPARRMAGSTGSARST